MTKFNQPLFRGWLNYNCTQSNNWIVWLNFQEIVNHTSTKYYDVVKGKISEITDRPNEINVTKPNHIYFTYMSLPVRSRSKAIMQAWLKENADYYMFMDADLSTDIKHIPELVKYLNKGYDIVIGSRRLPTSVVRRRFLRQFLSSCFHLLMHIVFGLKINDYQCGFKAITRKVRDHIIPQMKYTNEGFLDTEILVVANSKGYKIKEIPVRWYDTRPSKFKIHRAILMNLINTFKIKRDVIQNKYK